jgi:hypothetical protein
MVMAYLRHYFEIFSEELKSQANLSQTHPERKSEA